MPEAEDLAPAIDAAREQLSRVSDRLRSAPESRLTRRDDRLDGRSLAAAVHAIAQWAATMHGVTADVPALHPLASGDVLAVVGREFLDSLANSPPSDMAQTLEQWRQRVDELRAVV